jgi:hypothetical protein
VVDSFV